MKTEIKQAIIDGILKGAQNQTADLLWHDDDPKSKDEIRADLERIWIMAHFMMSRVDELAETGKIEQ